MEWNDVSSLAHWILRKKFKITDTNELIGEGFLCFNKCVPKFDPSRSNFASYFRTCFEGHMKDYFKYNSHLVAVPVNKAILGEETYAVGIDELIGTSKDGGEAITLLDVLESDTEAYDSEAKETARWLSYIDDIYPRLTKTEQEAVPHFKKYVTDGVAIPREYRTQAVVIRQHLLEYK